MRFILLLCFLFTQNILGQSLKKSLDSTISKHFEEKEVGGAFLIIENNKLLYEKGFGLADLSQKLANTPFTNFRLASMSKQFTAGAIVLLEKKGLISYEDKLSKFFPQFDGVVSNRIKIKHLLTHSSGILDYESLIPPNRQMQIKDADVVSLLATENKLYFEPGTDFRYSNSGFCLLSQIIAITTGIPFELFVSENIFKPLKLKNTYYYDVHSKMPLRALGYALNPSNQVIGADQSITSATKGDGCIYTNLRDFQLWNESLVNNTLFNLFEELQKVQSNTIRNSPLKYGLGWFFTQQDKNWELYHSGSTSGFSNGVLWLPQKKFLMVYLTNLADNHVIEEKIMQVLKAHKVLNNTFDFRKALSLTR
ncbi:serine hydrolase domain-containing protein [Flectobacillus sp. DC10W]|uniref:Serine hydrolase domain-containing protein n=1 Tax=Flectobacillus longus TaxID=2984207 RepID=A0ABT6YJP8_9BACT|nr:serine hydrolase domain-containing protein [Flectobacillus longus]MDI9863804.1 serine hydrolase domain-containing protein [Flectobacillus longus]